VAHTKRFPRRVTARLITPGRDGLSTPSCWRLALSSLSFPEICNWLAAQLMLSLLVCEAVISFGTARLPGGDLESTPAPAGEWKPFPPNGPRSFFLCFRWRWRCWKLRRLLTAGEPPAPHGADPRGPIDAVVLETCGVVTYVSSISSSMKSSPSELDDESESTWLLLPNELDMCIFSWLPIMDHSELEDCSIPKSPFRLPGMFMARDPMVGEESGEA